MQRDWHHHVGDTHCRLFSIVVSLAKKGLYHGMVDREAF